jgi:anti-sigma factor RsiW
MTAKHDPEDIHLLTGGYALDALDDLERTRFERHLLACESCLAEVTEFADVAAELGSGQVAPAPDPLRASVFAAVAKTPQLVPDAEPLRWPRPLMLKLSGATLMQVGTRFWSLSSPTGP